MREGDWQECSSPKLVITSSSGGQIIFEASIRPKVKAYPAIRGIRPGRSSKIGKGWGGARRGGVAKERVV